MAWGIVGPSSFGEFWPDGDFEGVDEEEKEGWRERLRAYFRDQSEQEQKRLFNSSSDERWSVDAKYAFYVSGKFTSELGTLEPGKPDEPPFTLIEPHEAPQFFKTIKRYQTLGSWIMLNNRVWAVDGTLKAIIERLEPGVHQLFPIEIRMTKGEIYPTLYYTLVIGNYFDSFSREQSKPDSFRSDWKDWYVNAETKKGLSGFAVSRSVFGDAHLWRERHSTRMLTCLSDELEGEITKARLRIPKHFRLKEV